MGPFGVPIVPFATRTGWFPISVLYGLEKHYKLFSRLINVNSVSSCVVLGYTVTSSS